MEENNYKPQIPDVMEAIFDAAYLIFDLVAAILLKKKKKGNILFVLYGILLNIDTLRRMLSSGAKNYKGSSWKR